MGQDIYELLARMQERPAMWLGAAKISLLEAFLNGFCYAQPSEAGRTGAWPPFWLLHDWTAHKFNQIGTTMGWARILTQHCKGDEEAALHLFFNVLEEFKTLRVVRIVEVQLSPAAHAFYASEACQIRRYSDADAGRLPAPASVCVVQFSDGLGHYVFHRQPGQDLIRDASYPSFRACLKRLRREFGDTLTWQEVGSLSAAAITALL